MENIDLDILSLDELKMLQKDVNKTIGLHETRRHQKALEALDAKAKEMGFSLTELTGGAKVKKPIHPPKYCHPENSSQTWSGRGRQPTWIKEGLATGKSLDEFLIVK